LNPDHEHDNGLEHEAIVEETETTSANPLSEASADEEPDPPKPQGVAAVLREAWNRARARRPKRKTSVVNSRAQVNDRSKVFLLLASAVVVTGFVFLAMFSTPSAEQRSRERRTTPRLGRPEAASEPSGQRSGSAVPLLSAEQNIGDPNADQLGPDDILATSRRTQAPPQPDQRNPASEYALSNVQPFGDPVLEAYRRQSNFQPPPPPAPAAPRAPAEQPLDESENLKKASMVFVRNVVSANAVNPSHTPSQPAFVEPNGISTLLPTGTRLVARLQTAVSSAVKTPAIAVIEYNYEHDGEIVVPAGTKAIGQLQQINQHGQIGIGFTMLQMPDGTTEAIAGTGIGLDYGPLKGLVNGRNRVKRALVRSLTGIGTMAAYLVGGRGYGGLSGPIDQSVLLRERIASNIGLAGEQELMAMAYSQNIVITVPGNTRFYIVLQEPVTAPNRPDTIPGAPSGRQANLVNAEGQVLPTAADLRELVALKNELNRMYREVAATRTAEQISPQQ